MGLLRIKGGLERLDEIWGIGRGGVVWGGGVGGDFMLDWCWDIEFCGVIKGGIWLVVVRLMCGDL